jgi:hypothetical protein
MSKSIFISCVYEDSPRINNIKNWVEQKRLGDVIITSETIDNRHKGVDAIKEHIQAKIQGATVVMVLVGQDTHNHDWIKAEVELANSFHKKILCLRVPNSTGAIPAILNKFKVLNFDPDTIKKELDSIK